MDLFKISGKIALDNADTNKKIDETTNKAKQSDANMSKLADGVVKWSKRAVIGLGAVATAIGVKATKGAMNFESEMSNVATLLDGNVNKRIGELGDKVLKVSDDTHISTDVMTDGLYQVISALGDSADSMNILETASKGAKAGNSTVTDSVNLLSAVMKGYGDVSKDSAKKVSDFAFTTVKLGQTTFPELAQSMGAVIPLASSMKIKQEELFGAMATLTGVTGNTSEVTTQLRGAIQGFMQPTDAMSTAMNKLGYENGQVMLKNLGLQGSLDALKKSVGGNEVAFAGLFGSVEAKNAVLALAGNQAENFTKKTEAMKKSTGATDEAFKKQTNNSKERIESMKIKIDNLVKKIGKQLLPTVEKGIKFVSDHESEITSVVQNVVKAISKLFKAIVKVVDFASKHKTLTKIIIGALTTLVGVLGAVALKFKVMELVAKYGKTLMKIFGLLTSKVGLIVLAIGVLIAIGVALYKNWDKISAKCKKVWNKIHKDIQKVTSKIKKTFQNLWKGIKNIFKPVVNWFKEKFQAVSKVVHMIVDPWVEIARRLMAIISGIIHKELDKIKKFFHDLWEGIKNIFMGAWKWFDDTVITPITNVFTKMWGKVKTGALGVWEGIKNVFRPVAQFFKTIFTNAWTSVKNVFSTGGKIFSGIKEGIEKAFKSIVNKLIDGINKVVSIPFKGINRMLSKLKNISILGVKPFTWVHTFNIPKIPHLETGGVLEKGQVGLLEGNGAEAVVPLEKNTQWINRVAEQMSKSQNRLNVDKLGSSSSKNDESYTVLDGKLSAILLLLEQYFPQIKDLADKNIVLDDGTLVGKLSPKIDNRLGDSFNMKARGMAR